MCVSACQCVCMCVCVPVCKHLCTVPVLMLTCVCTTMCVHVCACVALQHTCLLAGPGELTGGPSPPRSRRVSCCGGGGCCAWPAHLGPLDPVLVPPPFPLEVPCDLGVLVVRLGLSPHDQEHCSQACPEEASQLERTWPARWGPPIRQSLGHTRASRRLICLIPASGCQQ